MSSNHTLLVTAEDSWIYSACIYSFVPIIFYIINSTLIFLTCKNNSLKEKKELKNILIVSASINIISMFIYVAFSYFWWYCYLTKSYIHIKITTLVAELRLLGMGILFMSPLILSLWRFFLIVKGWNISIWKCLIGYSIFLSFHFYTFFDKAFVSDKIFENDIFTYSIVYSSQYIVFLFAITDIIPPIIAMILLFIILIYVKRNQEKLKNVVISKVRKNIVRQQRTIVYSLIILSAIPLLGAIPHYFMRMLFIFHYKVPRIGWNIAEFLILSVCGSGPICMVLVLPTLKKAFFTQLGFKQESNVETMGKKTDNDITKNVNSADPRPSLKPTILH
uniref:G-protein coupled receptors family 1 profile domain-containing protein n=1 Tax=Strongyloides stercoralis TaxID=6248 RepID=A0A0K0E7U8_STRER